ncbi:hypothetical protein D3H65_06575 [Paraflavitalea soli]|uniref:Uncharacterized protein n=1 Tax=Paraflavitalea soli TaxID=2315862 RepID=A0A3B7MK71_9BACT|nr:hypothetical protein D3H65_06575 [Paraflavitalea soli]
MGKVKPENWIQVIRELTQDKAMQEAGTLLLMIPNTCELITKIYILLSILGYVQKAVNQSFTVFPVVW